MERGIATLELLIALGVLTIVLSGVVIISFGSQVVALDTGVTTQALSITRSTLLNAKEAIENGNTFTATSTEGIFDFETTTHAVSECITEVETTARWWQDRLRPQDKTLSTFVVQDDVYDALLGECDTEAFAVGDWDSPSIVGQLSLSFITGVSDFDVVQRGASMYAFVVADNDATTTHDLFSIDVTDPVNLQRRGSFDFDPFILPVTAIDVGGDFAFVSTLMDGGELAVVDITSPDSPQGCPTLGTLPDVGTLGAISVDFYDGFVYVGTRETLNSEFHIFDASSPFLCDEGLSHIGDLAVNHTINDIEVQGDFAYLATSGDRCELLVVDVSDPDNLINNCPWGGGGGPMTFDALGLGDGMSVAAGSGSVFLGRDNSGDDGDFHILDVTNKNLITSVGQGNVGLTTVSDYVSGVVPRGDVLALGSTEDVTAVQLWDISKSDDPVPLGDPVDIGGPALTIEVFENTVYVLRGGSSPALIVIQP